MTVRDVWATYKDYTRDLTEHGRKLGFCGVAICWLFRNVDFTFPITIYAALLFFVAFFTADVLQYFLGALLHRFLAEKNEWNQISATGKTDQNLEIKKPRWLDWPAFICFLAKGSFLIAGFTLIGIHLAKILIEKKISG